MLLRLDGTIDSHGPVEDIIRHDKTIREAIAVAENLDEIEKEAETDEAEDKKKAAAGKLIIAEEMALGHVGWPACKLYSYTCKDHALIFGNIDRLYFVNLGGPFFYLAAYAFLLISCCMPLVNKGFLAYWSGKYEEMPTEAVPVRK